MAKTGRPPVISPGEYAALREVVRDNPQATLPELALAWAERMGRNAPSTVTLRAARSAQSGRLAAHTAHKATGAR